MTSPYVKTASERADWTDEERALARRLFVAHNTANGALLPDGFGFLSMADRKPWFEKARQQLAADELTGGLRI